MISPNNNTFSSDEMKAFVRQHFEDFVNNRNAAIIHRNMTAGFLDHDGPGGAEADAFRDEKMMQAMYEKMPGITVVIEDIIAEGDKVMCRNRWQWTEAGTGRQMEFHGFVLWRFENDKIAERWAAVTAPVAVAS